VAAIALSPPTSVWLEDVMSLRIALPTAHLLAAWFLIGGATPPTRQSRPASGAIDGVVTDTNLVPLPDATAWILGSSIRVVTGANGRFRILGLRAGEYILLVRRLGYAPASIAMQVADHDTVRPSFALERVAAELEPVVVAENRASTRMAEFEQRRKLGEGQFMTQAEIEKLNFVGPSDLLRTFMSVAVAGVDGIVVNRRALPIKTCPFQFFIDGVAIPMPKLIDTELPSPKELAGIEVYANSATVPLQYKTFGGSRGFSGGGGFCGVILLWTRDGS
jgi:hypothetical protein